MKTNKLWSIIMMLVIALSASISFSSCGSDDEDDNGVSQNSSTNTGKAPKWVKAVDLGLPSGTLWANCNIGASSPEDYGEYVAWGETVGSKSGKNVFSWDTYRYSNGEELLKYCTNSRNGNIDNKYVLDPEDDAAHVNWGGTWHMPSRIECKELINSTYTTISYTTQNGVVGCLVTSKKNGNSIFFPAAGMCCHNNDDDEDVCLYEGEVGHFWTNEMRSDYPTTAYGLYFYVGYDKKDSAIGHDNRRSGLTIRPVCTSK